MKHDLTIDSQATREWVAKEIFGWIKKPWAAPSGTVVTSWEDSLGNEMANYGTLPNFLHSSEWTGPLLLRAWALWPKGVLKYDEHDSNYYFYTNGNMSSFSWYKGRTPQIAIAQAIQQMQEER